MLRPGARRRLGVASTAMIMVVVGCSPSARRAVTPTASTPPTSTSHSTSPASTIGATGAGDPYFPLQGNGGYDATRYDLDLRWTPGVTERLSGTAQIRATATQRLTRFDLDLRPNMQARSVTVDGRPAGHVQPTALQQELVITPARALAPGQRFTIAIRYAGAPGYVTDPDGFAEGWITSSSGAFVADESQGAPSWFPVDDTPLDKATYTVTMDVPSGYAAIGNGRLAAHTESAGRSRWTWSLDEPVSSYLITATIGRFRLTTGRTPAGVPYLIAVDPTQRNQSALLLRELPKIVDFFADRYGPYPFGQTGAIVDDVPQVGYAIETATRPLFASAPSEHTLAHELAHQWFGDTVTLARWRDIWINEGFAEFSAWLWDQQRGAMTLREHLLQLLAMPASASVWNPPPADPGSARQLFASSMYERGAGALEALREYVGDGVFFSIMRGWVQEHRYGNATVAQFARYAQQVSHRDLSHLFYEWLYRSGKPSA